MQALGSGFPAIEGAAPRDSGGGREPRQRAGRRDRPRHSGSEAQPRGGHHRSRRSQRGRPAQADLRRHRSARSRRLRGDSRAGGSAAGAARSPGSRGPHDVGGRGEDPRRQGLPAAHWIHARRAPQRGNGVRPHGAAPGRVDPRRSRSRRRPAAPARPRDRGAEARAGAAWFRGLLEGPWPAAGRTADVRRRAPCRSGCGALTLGAPARGRLPALHQQGAVRPAPPAASRRSRCPT